MTNKLYGRLIILKNCGRFLNIASDFGSEYKTHPFLTEQMVYAGLTRENELDKDDNLLVEKGIVPDGKYNFNDRYKIPNNKYFTCGYLINKNQYELEQWHKNRDNSDKNDFNSINEITGQTKNSNNLPTYGNIESILPNNNFITFAFSNGESHLNKYYSGQTFYMGKKRTMFQIKEMSRIIESKLEEREADIIIPIQVINEQVDHFKYYNILTLTQRFILIKGQTKFRHNYNWKLNFKGISEINLPDFFVNPKVKEE